MSEEKITEEEQQSKLGEALDQPLGLTQREFKKMWEAADTPEKKEELKERFPSIYESTIEEEE